MTVKELLNSVGLTVVAATGGLDGHISRGYASDLLSNVMGLASPASVWVTMQGHPNIIAVAALGNLAAVIVAGGVEPEKETVEKAQFQGIVLLTSQLPSFELVGQLYKLGIKGI